MAGEILEFAQAFEATSGLWDKLSLRRLQLETAGAEAKVSKAELQARLRAIAASQDPNSLSNRLATKKMQNELALAEQQERLISQNLNKQGAEGNQAMATTRASYAKLFFKDKATRDLLIARLEDEKHRNTLQIGENELRWYKENAAKAPYALRTRGETEARLIQTLVASWPPHVRQQLALLLMNQQAEAVRQGNRIDPLDAYFLQMIQQNQGGVPQGKASNTDWEGAFSEGRRGESLTAGLNPLKWFTGKKGDHVEPGTTTSSRVTPPVATVPALDMSQLQNTKLKNLQDAFGMSTEELTGSSLPWGTKGNPALYTFGKTNLQNDYNEGAKWYKFYNEGDQRWYRGEIDIKLGQLRNVGPLNVKLNQRTTTGLGYRGEALSDRGKLRTGIRAGVNQDIDPLADLLK